MSNAPWLTLIVPGIGAALAHVAETAQMEQSGQTVRDRTQLARIAGRGSLRYAWDRRDPMSSGLRSWQRGLLDALELPAAFPSAAVSAYGSIDAMGQANWLHADPVHFIAGLDRLSFLTLEGAARVMETERAALEPVLADHLRSWNCHLHPTELSAWLIGSDRAFDVVTVNPEAAAANELEHVMPEGPNAGELRCLMTELQMLLHDHPVNDARARRGLPAINAVWLWGTGSIAPTQTRLLPLAFGTASYLTGIYKLHGHAVQSAPFDCDELISRIKAAGRAVAVVPMEEIDALETQWIEPLMRALAGRVIGRVDLILDGWHLEVSRASLRRFWRRPLPPAQWFASEPRERLTKGKSAKGKFARGKFAKGKFD